MLAGLFFARRMFREPFLVVILLSIVFLFFTQLFRVRLRNLQNERRESEQVKPPEDVEAKSGKKTFSPKLLVLILIAFFYWGSEQSINMWLVVYLHVGALFDSFLSSMTLALFWASMGIGRIVIGPFADRFGIRRMMLSLGVIGSAALLLNYVSAGYALVADWCIIGFIYSVIFPGIMALAYEAFPESAGTAIGAVHTFGVFGGIIMPAAIGILVMLTGAGAAITVITANLVLMCVFVYVLGKLK
jgi:fucose permease